MWDLLECNGYLGWKISILHLYDSVYMSAMLQKVLVWDLWTDDLWDTPYILFNIARAAWLLMLVNVENP